MNDIINERLRRFASTFSGLAEEMAQLSELGLPFDAVAKHLQDTLPAGFQDRLKFMIDEIRGAYVPPPIDGLIKLLLDEAPKMTNSDGTPDTTQNEAVQCHVLLRGQMQPLFGALSLHRLGVLRMLTPSKVQHPGEAKPREILLEQFFDIEEVQSVMVEREVKATPGSRIFTGAS